jgi:hypothetical protein
VIAPEGRAVVPPLELQKLPVFDGHFGKKYRLGGRNLREIGLAVEENRGYPV